MDKYYEFQSWLKTIASTLIIEFAAEILFGLGVFAETGSYTAAGLFALLTATARTILKLFLNKAGKKLQSLKED